MPYRVLVVVVSALLLALPNASFSAGTSPPVVAPAPEEKSVGTETKNEAKAVSYPSDEDKLDGDHLRLKVNAFKFKDINDPTKPDKLRCAPKGSIIIVTKASADGNIYLRFHSVGSEDDFYYKIFKSESAALDSCPISSRVNVATQYSINKEDLFLYDFRRSGVIFGGVVVPFKYYLGGDKKISPSSTVAPYIGFRGSAPFGLTFTPIISAGLGLVPVSNSDTNKTDTKTAFSTAIGLVLNSKKNQNFNAGLVIGRDFLSKDDRASDPTVSKAWFSVYLGYSL